jgi:tRNA pseudouridine55 synthase
VNRRPTAPDGVVVVDKPSGWTSHDVVARMRRLAGTRKVGHAGTLDPMATGVLVVGIGRATRLLTYLTGADKEYRATIRLGVSTTTDDAEGEVVAVHDATGVDPDDLVAGVRALTGRIEQVPSSVSAIKVDGVRSYARVRAGEEVVLPARPVTVYSFDVHAVVPGDGVLDIDATVVCSSGTYIRALARDLGAGLGVGGHLTELRRTRVAALGLDVARDLDELAAGDPGLPIEVLAPATAAAAVMPVRQVDQDEAADLGHGRSIVLVDEDAGVQAAVDENGLLVAVVQAAGGRSRPVLVLAPR